MIPTLLPNNKFLPPDSCPLIVMHGLRVLNNKRMFQGLGSKYIYLQRRLRIGSRYTETARPTPTSRPRGIGYLQAHEGDHKRLRFAVSYLATKTHKPEQIGTSAMMNVILNRLFSRSYLLPFITCDLRKVTAATAAGRRENLPFFFPASETSEQRLPASPLQDYINKLMRAIGCSASTIDL